MVGHLPGGERILAPGQSFQVSLALPFDDQKWRANISYTALMTEPKFTVEDWLSKVGLGFGLWPEHTVYAGPKPQ